MRCISLWMTDQIVEKYLYYVRYPAKCGQGLSYRQRKEHINSNIW